MKTMKIIIMVFIMNAVLGIAFLTIDNKLAFYGKSTFYSGIEANWPNNNKFVLL
jgi:hypothetical protein